MERFLLAEISDESSSGEDEERLTPSSNAAGTDPVPYEFSIDALLADRERENRDLPKEPHYEDPEDAPNLDLPELPGEFEFGPDNTIYQDFESHWPMIIFDYLSIEPRKPSNVIALAVDSWIHLAARHYAEQVHVDDTVIYSLLNGLIATGDTVFGETLILLYPFFHDELDLACMVYLLQALIAERGEELAVYPLILFHVAFFGNIEPYLNDFFLIHFASLMTTAIVKHPEFFRTEEARSETMRPSNLELSSVVAEIIAAAPISCLSDVIEFVPKDTDSAFFLRNVYLRVLLKIAQMDGEEVPDERSAIVDLVLFVEGMLREMIERMDEESLLNASAVLAIVEKIVAASGILREIYAEDATKISNALRFTIHVNDTAQLTSIKEQLQHTRTQIDSIAQEAHFDHDPSVTEQFTLS